MLLGTLKALEIVLYAFPDNTTLYREFLGHDGLVLFMRCSVNCGTLYMQLFVFLNYVKLIQFASQIVDTDSDILMLFYYTNLKF